MGGTKKKSLASMEKQQESQDEQAAGEKGKKSKDKGAPQQQKRLPFLPPKMSDAEMVKALTPIKAITVYSASKALGVNASIATGVLRGLESRNLISKRGGSSGHTIWGVGEAS